MDSNRCLLQCDGRGRGYPLHLQPSLGGLTPVKSVKMGLNRPKVVFLPCQTALVGNVCKWVANGMKKEMQLQPCPQVQIYRIFN
jgi:hypothetical protein